MKPALHVIALIASLSALAEQSKSYHFDAAVVRPVGKDTPVQITGGPGSSDPGRVKYVHVSLRTLINNAYSIPIDRISGPSIIDSEFYSIQATLPASTTMDELKIMLANLLVERFGLQFHREDREKRAYEIVVADGGTKLRPSRDTHTADVETGTKGQPKRDADGFPINPPGVHWQAISDGDQLRMTFSDSTLKYLANRLTAVFHSQEVPVVDKTGLTGTFDFRLACPVPAIGLRLRALQMQAGISSGSQLAPTDPAAGIESLGKIMEKQLGLRLVAGKSMLEFLVVDHINSTPTDN
jgi:uncharacterized protein (TIGR03435 family)